MDLAKNTIKYRTQDAKASGIHPLYALGAPSMSMTPVMSGQGDSIAQAGDAVGRGISTGYEKQLQQKNLENIQADIDLKKAQSANYVMEAKKASNLMMRQQTGRIAGNENDVKIGGTKINQNKGWSNAEDIETRYGDLVSWLYGMGVIGGDFIENLPRIEKWQEENRKRRDAEWNNRPYEGNIGRNGKIIGF